MDEADPLRAEMARHEALLLRSEISAWHVPPEAPPSGGAWRVGFAVAVGVGCALALTLLAAFRSV